MHTRQRRQLSRKPMGGAGIHYLHVIHPGTDGGGRLHGNGKYQPEHEERATECKQRGTSVMLIEIATGAGTNKRTQELDAAIDTDGGAFCPYGSDLGNE